MYLSNSEVSLRRCTCMQCVCVCVCKHLNQMFKVVFYGFLLLLFFFFVNLLYFNTFKATPFPNSFKCFTCDNAVDNYNCNRWAEDRWCPESKCFCTKGFLPTQFSLFLPDSAVLLKSNWIGLTYQHSDALNYVISEPESYDFCWA